MAITFDNIGEHIRPELAYDRAGLLSRTCPVDLRFLYNQFGPAILNQPTQPTVPVVPLDQVVQAPQEPLHTGEAALYGMNHIDRLAAIRSNVEQSLRMQ